MITFKCKASGNTVSFTREDDIVSMRKEPDYEEITKEIEHEKEIRQEASKEVLGTITVKKLGRPSKK
jgi:hypothetical protein